MASVRFIDVQVRPTEFLDFTSLTLDEFQQLLPPFEAAFKLIWLDGAWMANRASPASLPSTKTVPCRRQKISSFYSGLRENLPLQVVQGRLFGMGQSKANQWIHVLLPVLLAALHPRRCPCPFPDGSRPAPRCLRGRTPRPWSSRWRRSRPSSPRQTPPRP